MERVAAREALYQVLEQHLRNYSPVWGERITPKMIATAKLTKPRLMFFALPGVNADPTPVRKAHRFTVTVKLVADDMATALVGQADISRALANSGTQNVDPRLPAHADWHVLTVNEDREVYLEDPFAGAVTSYHAGHQYVVLMERRA